MAKKSQPKTKQDVTDELAISGQAPITVESFQDIERKIGRPTKINDALIAEVSNLILRGNYIVTSCLAVGISRSLYDQWMIQAHSEMEKGLTEANSELIRFLLACEKARSRAEVILTSQVMTRDHYWQRWAWMLERTRPGTYGPRQQIDISQDVTVTSLSSPPMATSYVDWVTQALVTDSLVRPNAMQESAIDAEYEDDGGEKLVRIEG